MTYGLEVRCSIQLSYGRKGRSPPREAQPPQGILISYTHRERLSTGLNVYHAFSLIGSALQALLRPCDVGAYRKTPIMLTIVLLGISRSSIKPWPGSSQVDMRSLLPGTLCRNSEERAPSCQALKKALRDARAP